LTDQPEKTLIDWENTLARAARRFTADVRVSLFLEDRHDLRAEMGVDGVWASVPTRHRGLAIRCYKDDREQLLYVSDPGPDDVDRLARAAVESGFMPEPCSRAATTAEAWPEWAGRPVLAYPGDEDVAVTLRWNRFEQRIVVAGADGRVLRDTRRGERIRVEARHRSGQPGDVGVAEAVLGGTAQVDRKRIDSTVTSARARAEQRTEARSITPGRTSVVLAPGVGGILIHEIVGHPLEADRLLAGRSWLSGVEGPVGDPSLTVIDDPRRGRASWRIDDEGEAARPTPLIRSGRVVARLHDRRSARAAGQSPNGHGRCASFREPPRPRMGCTFVAAGPMDPEEVFQGVADGIYVRRMEAGSTSPSTGRAVFRVGDADRIRDGRIAEPLLPHLLEVDGATTLRQTRSIAGDLLFDTCIGTCHRDGQPLAITVGAPTICIGLATVLA